MKHSLPTRKLPDRPDLGQLKRQAKELLRAFLAGEENAVAEVNRFYHDSDAAKFALHDAQLVLAREYGFPGWQNLVKEVKLRLGRGLEWAVSDARRIIHANDVESLRRLLADYPALVSWIIQHLLKRFLISIPLCCAVLCLRPESLCTRSPMSRPTCFR